MTFTVERKHADNDSSICNVVDMEHFRNHFYDTLTFPEILPRPTKVMKINLGLTFCSNSLLTCLLYITNSISIKDFAREILLRVYEALRKQQINVI